MTCEDSNYYPMNYYSTNYYPGYYPDSMMRSSAAQQPVGGFPTMMPAGAQPTGFPMGCILDPRLPSRRSRWEV